MGKNLTEKQQKFLDVLFEEAKGNPTKAKKLAGYCDTLATATIVNALQEEIGNFGEKTIGIRPGEKLHETLINKEEIRYSWEYENLYIITPPHYSTFHSNPINESYKNIKKLEGMNEYSSDIVPTIPINELKNIFKNLI